MPSRQNALHTASARPWRAVASAVAHSSRYARSAATKASKPAWRRAPRLEPEPPSSRDCRRYSSRPSSEGARRWATQAAEAARRGQPPEGSSSRGSSPRAARASETSKGRLLAPLPTQASNSEASRALSPTGTGAWSASQSTSQSGSSETPAPAHGSAPIARAVPAVRARTRASRHGAASRTARSRSTPIRPNGRYQCPRRSRPGRRPARSPLPGAPGRGRPGPPRPGAPFRCPC